MTYVIKTALFSCVLFLLVGCDDTQQQAVFEQRGGDKYSATISNEQKPPALLFQAGDAVIKTYRGTYTWHTFDQKSKQMMVTQADHRSPPEMVRIEDGRALDLSQPITLTFSTPPTSYEIRVWDNQQVIATYPSFAHIKQRGKYIIEIVGYWEESRATYVAALDVQ